MHRHIDIRICAECYPIDEESADMLDQLNGQRDAEIDWTHSDCQYSHSALCVSHEAGCRPLCGSRVDIRGNGADISCGLSRGHVGTCVEIVRCEEHGTPLFFSGALVGPGWFCPECLSGNGESE